MFPDTSYRTDEEEEMDDFTLEGESFGKVLDSVARINQWLGGNQITKNAIKEIFRTCDNMKVIHIIDAGCGNGDMCRQVAKLAKKLNQKVKITGVDANPFTIEYARKQSSEFSDIEYICMDIFSDAFYNMPKDILLSTLTLHHFKDEQIVSWLRNNLRDNTVCIVNDLERSGLAYRLFQGLCFITRMDEMNRKDGLVSILRGFKRKDLMNYTELLNKGNTKVTSSIQWKWAFRYLWIIKNI